MSYYSNKFVPDHTVKTEPFVVKSWYTGSKKAWREIEVSHVAWYMTNKHMDFPNSRILKLYVYGREKGEISKHYNISKLDKEVRENLHQRFNKFFLRKDIFDSETTGLKSSDRPLSMGIYKNGKTFEVYLNWQMDSHPEALKTHGITREKLERIGGDPKIELEKMSKYLDGKIVLAFNSEFDRKKLEDACRAVGIPKPNCVWVDAYLLIPLLGGRKKMRLVKHMEAFGLGTQSHGAADDCLKTHQVMECLVK